MGSLKLVKIDGFFKFDKDSITELQKHKDKSEIYLKIINKEIYRSLQQNKYYWKVILKMILYYLPENLLNPQPKDVKQLHSFLMFGYGIAKGKIEIINYKGKKIPIRPSWKFDEMTNKEANEYLKFIENWVCQNIDDYNKLIQEYENKI